MQDGPRVLVLTEFWDRRGFGLSGAALAYTRHLSGARVVAAMGIHSFSGEEPADLPLVPGGAARWQRPLKHAPAVVRVAQEREVQVVHLHGCWTWAVSTIPALQRLGCKVVLSPHGMFEPYILGRNRWKKQVMDLTFHRAAVAGCDLIHALNQHEADCARAYLGQALRGEVAVLANGVECPTDAPLPTTGPVVLLFCGRFDRKKRVDLLLEAWAAAGVSERAELHLAGGGDDDYARQVTAQAQATPGVRLLGQIGGPAKAAAFAASHLGILASQSEGQPLALLESLAAGRAVIATPGCRLPEAERHGLGWCVEGRDGLAEAIRTAVAEDSAARQERGLRAAAYAREHHHWPTVGERLGQLYRRLAEGRT